MCSCRWPSCTSFSVCLPASSTVRLVASATRTTVPGAQPLGDVPLGSPANRPFHLVDPWRLAPLSLLRADPNQRWQLRVHERSANSDSGGSAVAADAAAVRSLPRRPEEAAEPRGGRGSGLSSCRAVPCWACALVTQAGGLDSTGVRRLTSMDHWRMTAQTNRADATSHCDHTATRRCATATPRSLASAPLPLPPSSRRSLQPHPPCRPSSRHPPVRAAPNCNGSSRQQSQSRNIVRAL